MAQTDIFIKINGIDGESQDDEHKGEIDVLEWLWGVAQYSHMHAGSGGGAAKASVSDLTIEKHVDRASPNLMKYCLTGKHIDQAVLTMRKAGGTPLDYLKITMTDVLITLVSPKGSGTGAHETVSLSFAKVKQEYLVQNKEGGSGGAVTASFDIKANKEM
ncbi:type VI secretion system tube protein Hcp [Paraburkholderia sediminicola]|nr:type VI secretion system tube protein Hcp [Paraburkholderia sediminicola]